MTDYYRPANKTESNMKKITILSVFFSVVAITFSALIYLTSPKYAYVNVSKLYDEFIMKKELEKKLEGMQMSRKNVLDSLEFQLKTLTSSIKEMTSSDKMRNGKIEQFQYKKQDYLMKQKMFAEDTERATESFHQQILTQLNQYISDYGKEKGFTYILGADGSNAVLFASETEEITEQLKVYVNARYKGGVKI
jgi:outer membrane protein